MKIAFQGEHGAYSEMAVFQHFGKNAQSHPVSSFHHICEAINSGDAEYGLLPVENTLGGTVLPAYEALLAHDLAIQHEVVIPIKHCLVALPGIELNEIETVISHPQALSQCRDRLKTLGYEPKAHYDTAGAAKYVAENKSPSIAAIASTLAAKTYGLQILIRNLEDRQFNFTRFFVLGKNKPKTKLSKMKTSLIFSTQHKPHALTLVLNEFAARDINLTKIESHPSREKAWDYVFYLDFEGSIEDANCKEVIKSIGHLTNTFRVLGSYSVG